MVFDGLMNVEIERSKELHKFYPLDIFRKLAILHEECGEVAKAVNDYVDRKDTLEHLKEELVQTAAMCKKMYESLENAKSM